MSYVNFENGVTPVNDENLNRMQKNEITTGQEFETNTYIDGKRLYGKIFDFNSLPDNSYVEQSLGFILSEVTVYAVIGVAKSNSFNIFPIPFGDENSETSATISLRLKSDNNTIRIATHNRNFEEGNAKVSIYYTKNEEE